MSPILTPHEIICEESKNIRSTKEQRKLVLIGWGRSIIWLALFPSTKPDFYTFPWLLPAISETEDSLLEGKIQWNLGGLPNLFSLEILDGVFCLLVFYFLFFLFIVLVPATEKVSRERHDDKLTCKIVLTKHLWATAWSKWQTSIRIITSNMRFSISEWT